MTLKEKVTVSQMSLSLRDKNIGMLFDNISTTFHHLREFELKSSFYVVFAVAWNMCNMALLILHACLRDSYLFFFYCNVVIFVSVVYCRENGRNQVTSRYLSLLNHALWPCFLQVHLRGGKLELKSLAKSESESHGAPLRLD